MSEIHADESRQLNDALNDLQIDLGVTMYTTLSRHSISSPYTVSTTCIPLLTYYYPPFLFILVFGVDDDEDDDDGKRGSPTGRSMFTGPRGGGGRGGGAGGAGGSGSKTARTATKGDDLYTL